MSKPDATITGNELRADLEFEAVRSLMCSMVRDSHLLSDFFDVCPDKAFASPKVKDIALALKALSDSGEKPGLPELLHIMGERYGRDPERFPKPDAHHIAELASSAYVGRDQCLFFARRLADEFRRETIHDSLAEVLVDSGSYGTSADELAARLRAIADASGSLQTVPSMRQVMMDVLKTATSEDYSITPTPWNNLNRALRGGLKGQELVVLAGRPGTGKTAFAGCIAVETARAGRSVLFVSREMGADALGARMLAREARVDNRFYRERLASDVTLEQLYRAADAISELPLSIVERSTGPMCPREVRRLARGLKNLGLVVVDYLQLMQPDVSSKSREVDVASMSRAFKSLAMDLGVPVVLLSQLNRSSEDGDRRPQLSDLRESGAIEQDADIVILLHTAKRDRAESRAPVEAIIAKSRSTATGSAHFLFDKAVSDFAETMPLVQTDRRQPRENDL